MAKKLSPTPSPITPANSRDPYPQQLIPLTSIVRDEKNHRLESRAAKAKFQELVASIRADGQLQPVLVYPEGGKYHLVFGSGRVDAQIALQRENVLAMVMDHVPDETETQRLRAVENLKRRDITPAEACVAIAHVVAAVGDNIDRAAAELGMDPAEVRDRWYVYQRLLPKVRDMLGEGRLTLAQARELAKVDGHAQLDIADDIQLDGTHRGQRVYTAEEVRGMVENQKRSLRVVPWLLDKSFAGKPACAGCKNNTATDVTLFETPKDEAEKGCCMDSACFDWKAKKAQESQEKANAKVRELIKAKRIDKADATSAAVIGEVTPAFMKPTSVQRVVAQEFKPQTKSGNAKQAKKETAKPKTELERRQEALLAYADKYRAWRDEILKKMELAAKVRPELMLLALVVQASRIVIKEAEYNLPYSLQGFDPQYGNYRKMKEPPSEHISPRLAGMLDPAHACSHDNLLSLIDGLNWELPVRNPGPELMQRIAKAFGVDPQTPPAFEDFLPLDLSPKKAGVSAKTSSADVTNPNAQ
ncbi:MAG: ParB/RepB/Spo0J family partition protein [Phycisphaerales bacterium]|nr:ParB/RepB/Spo0J family partition protein [Phycisphaerales bacterium]